MSPRNPVRTERHSVSESQRERNRERENGMKKLSFGEPPGFRPFSTKHSHFKLIHVMSYLCLAFSFDGRVGSILPITSGKPQILRDRGGCEKQQTEITPLSLSVSVFLIPYSSPAA